MGLTSIRSLLEAQSTAANGLSSAQSPYMSRDVSKVKIKQKLKIKKQSNDLTSINTYAPVHRIARQRSKNMLGITNSLEVLASAHTSPPQ